MRKQFMWDDPCRQPVQGNNQMRLVSVSLIVLLAATASLTTACVTGQPIVVADAKGKGHPHGMPPGQAKKWARGNYLPRTIVWTPAPTAVVAKLKPVPPGHRYVMIDGQVLLIAIATGLVLDALGVI
jgi:Ni/Co efflux regulator RcnB